uniref:Uncharacterized protein n=1 Tax=Peronospora matthiolae TaxID=2874970 RepID=A0AAV1TAY8_9STRA
MVAADVAASGTDRINAICGQLDSESVHFELKHEIYLLLSSRDPTRYDELLTLLTQTTLSRSLEAQQCLATVSREDATVATEKGRLKEYHLSPSQSNFWQLQLRGLCQPNTTRNTSSSRADGLLLAKSDTSDTVTIPGGLDPAIHKDSIVDATHPPKPTSRCTALAVFGLAGDSTLLLTEKLWTQGFSHPRHVNMYIRITDSY